MIEMPLLAETAKPEDFPNIKYPVIGSAKLDGIRCLKVNGKMVSRNFKEIPNEFIAKELAKIVPEGFDGELLLRSITRPPRTNPKKDPEGFEKEVKEITKFNELAKKKPHLIPFNYVSSEVMRFEGEPDYVFYAFDYVTDPLIPYQQRILNMQKAAVRSDQWQQRVVLVPTFIINNEEELSLAEQKCIDEGFEGLMIRDPNGQYYTPRYLAKKALGKRADNRSNSKEGILLKIKRFEDGEAKIIGYQEARSNQNEKETNIFGYSERSSKKEGIVLKDTLGALIVKDLETDIEFKVGSGFDDPTRDWFWANREKMLGEIIKYKCQPAGKKERPRFPTYVGIRHPNDMS